METFSKGLILDSTEKMQPQDSYRFALNAILETKENGHGAISNELGNDLCVELPEGYSIIGHVIADADDIIIFVTNNTTSIIGLYNPVKCTFTSVVESDCLGFNDQYPIEAIFRIRKGCNRTIYFTDNYNSYKYFDFEEPDKFKDAEGNWDCNKFSFAPDLSIPKIDQVTVLDTGGQLPVGAYQFAIRYLDRDLNATDFFYITRTVNIYDDPISSDYAAINGGINIIDNADELGAVPVTAKSINLELSNLDNTYYYYQVAVIASTEASGTASTVYLLNPVGISNADSDVYTVSNFVDTGVVVTTVADLAVKNPVFNKIKSQVQLDNTLYVAGTATKEYNWAEFQKAANDITVSWFIDRVKAQDQYDEGNCKNPVTPFGQQTFMGDEIYALGIEFFLNDGTVSPQFHIPGRISTVADTQSLTVGTNIVASEVAHLGITSGSYPKWQLLNTATLDGQLGYYEIDVAYPDSVCNDERVFPQGNIRYHRMPDRKLIPTWEVIDGQTVLNRIGLEFANVTYPSTDIVGHRFVYGQRTPADTTVIDGGVIVPSAYLSVEEERNPDAVCFEGLYISLAESKHADTVRFISPAYLTKNTSLRPDHIKVEGTLARVSDSRETENLDLVGNNTELHTIGNRVNYSATRYSTTFANLQVLDSVFIRPNTFQDAFGVFNKDLRNYSLTNTIHVNKLGRSITVHTTGTVPSYDPYDITVLYQGVLKRSVTPFRNLFGITYIPLHSTYKTLDDEQKVFGDVYIVELKYFDIYDQFDLREGSILNTIVWADLLSGVYVESRVNFELIHPGDTTCNRIYNSTETMAEHIVHKVAYIAEVGEAWTLRTSPCEEYYGYNKDFSKIPDDAPNFSLPVTQNYCSSCLDEYPYRIYYSEQSFQEEVSDNYRIIKPNSYRDLPGAFGSITDLFVEKDKLYCRTPKGLFFIPTSPQTLTTNEDNIYVGTGDKLSIPPARLASPDYGYGGSSYRWTKVSTEFGTAFVDDRSNKIFLLSDKLNELSAKGLSNFFAENLTLFLDIKMLETLGISYPIKSPISYNGIGFLLTYDPKFRRLIVHKTDYEPLYPLEDVSATTDYQPNIIYYDAESQRFSIFNVDSFINVDLNNTDYFRNRSFTISYSFEYDVWVSFHSYLPDYIFNDNYNFYSTQSNSIFKHNVGYYQQYYGTKADHIIEVIFNEAPAQTKVFTGVNYVSDVQEYIPTSDQYRNVLDTTFDRLIAYNTVQSTGLQNILFKGVDNPFANYIQDGTDGVYATYKDFTWKINELRDYNISGSGFPLFTSQWADIKNDYFIDKVAENLIIDYTRSLFEAARFRDKWLGLRLYFNPSANYRISTSVIDAKTKLSSR